MKKTVQYHISKLFLAIFFVFAFGLLSAEQTKNDTPVALGRIHNAIDKVFTDMDSDLKAAADKVAQSGIEADTMNNVLLSLCEKYPAVVDCSYVTPNGILKIIQPKEYKSFENSDILYQEHVAFCLKNKKPVMSKAFKSVEGFYAVDLEQPIIKGNELLGSLSMLIRPETFISKIVEKEISGMPVRACIMESEGRILYDPDKEEIGKNLFSDEMYKQYPTLLEAGKKIIQEESGETTYEFLATGMKEKTNKRIFWSTINVHSTIWKVALILENSSNTEVKNGAKQEKSDLEKLKQALRNVTSDEQTLSFFEKNDKEKIRKVLSEFYKNHPEIYCISWIDKDLSTRFGEPKENSLDNYKFTKEKDKESLPLIKAVETKTESEFSIPLFEGKTGDFFISPLILGDKYFGMLYYIITKE